MTNHADWQTAVGRNWASAYQRTDRSFAGLTDRLLTRISEFDGSTVLDIGCGAGELSLAIARARPRASVIGVDISYDLITAAQERAGERTQLRFELADAAQWQEPGLTPDLLVSRHGVMFFDDPIAAFARLHAQASETATLVFSCFRHPRENPWASGVAELLDQMPGDPDAPGPFAFADPQRVEAILGKADWGRIDFEPVDFAWIAGKGEDPVADAMDYLSQIGPAAPTLRALEGTAREEAEARLRDWLVKHRSGDVVAFAAAAWIVTAHADRRSRTR